MARRPNQTQTPTDDDAANATATETVTVICAVKDGRRRGGRRWDGGKTEVPLAQMTGDLRTALDGDPMFSIVE